MTEVSAFAKQRSKRGVSRWSIFSKRFGSIVTHPGEHQWKYFGVKDDDSDNDEDNKNDNDNNDEPIYINKDKDEYAVVVVGTTGAGKSSVVSLFCGKKAQVSDATESCTKDVTIFPELNNDDYIAKKNRSWVDTQGTDDSEMDDTDEKILKKIFKKLYNKKLADVLIIWTVAGDMDRQKGEYLKQASFISGFQTKNSKTNVWASTLIIQKMGQLQPKNSQIRGVIEAAKVHGAESIYTDNDIILQHLIGCKCLEMFNVDDDDTYQTLVEGNTKKQKMQKLGYVTKIEMQEFINEKLKNLKTFRVEFEDKICIKCSLRGDPRYLYYKCHSNPIPKHPKGLVPFHPDIIQNYHPMDTHVIHPGKIKQFHSDELEKFHKNELTEIEITEKDPIYKHSGQFITIVNKGCCGGKTRFEWDCCGALEKDAKGCKEEYPKKKILHYPCCKTTKEHNSDKNHEFYSGCEFRWKCCAKVGKDAKSCNAIYECCNGEPTAKGCVTTWICCEKDVDAGDPGCKKRYKCCQMPEGARGCDDHFECCEKPKNTKGCETVCDRCAIKWGKKPGCLWPAQDKSYDSTDEQNDNDYDEDANELNQINEANEANEDYDENKSI